MMKRQKKDKLKKKQDQPNDQAKHSESSHHTTKEVDKTAKHNE